jgi:hypothetical protein
MTLTKFQKEGLSCCLLGSILIPRIKFSVLYTCFYSINYLLESFHGIIQARVTVIQLAGMDDVFSRFAKLYGGLGG